MVGVSLWQDAFLWTERKGKNRPGTNKRIKTSTTQTGAVLRIIILGCGRLGSELANVLSLEGHGVTIIDRDPESFDRLPSTFKGKRVVGHGFDQSVLRQAGIERADGFVAVTGGDNHNIVTARIAREDFQVARVVARINDPRRAEIYRRLGIPTVGTAAWATNKIRDLVEHPSLYAQLTFGSGEVELLRVELPNQVVGKSVGDLSVPGEILIAAITRLGEALIPNSDTVIEEGDVARIIIHRMALPKLERLLGFK